MLTFLPVPIEVACFLISVVVLVGYALLAGNGCPDRSSTSLPARPAVHSQLVTMLSRSRVLLPAVAMARGITK